MGGLNFIPFPIGLHLDELLHDEPHVHVPIQQKYHHGELLPFRGLDAIRYGNHHGVKALVFLSFLNRLQPYA
jgi:hypothetical protein